MDIQLPGMDGYSAARSIRSMDRADAIVLPVLAMTADALTQDVDKALQCGMNAHKADYSRRTVYEALLLLICRKG